MSYPIPGGFSPDAAVAAAQQAQQLDWLAKGWDGLYMQPDPNLMALIERGFGTEGLLEPRNSWPVQNAPAGPANGPAPSNSWDTAEKLALPILAAAIAIHVASMFTTGLASGPPDAGDGLAAGVDAFQGASEILGSAGSDPGWQGPAAQSYNARNTEQQNRTNQMAALDTELATLLQTQAAEVKKLRIDMYIVLSVLITAKPIAMMLYKTPAVGPQLSTTYQIATAGACLTTTTGLLSAQRVRSNKTGAALNNVAESYAQIADAAVAARSLH